MTIYEDTNPKPLSIYWIGSTRRYGVPDFQRDLSGSQCYPGADSFSNRQTTTPPAVSCAVRDLQKLSSSREFEGAPAATPSNTFLCSMARATHLPLPGFYGLAIHRYYLDIRALIDGADFEDAIGYHAATTEKAVASERRSSCRRAAPASTSLLQ